MSKMKKARKKLVFLDVIREGTRIPAVVNPGMRAEDVLIANGLAGFRLGILAKGPYLEGGEKLFEMVYPGQTLSCVFYAN